MQLDPRLNRHIDVGGKAEHGTAGVESGVNQPARGGIGCTSMQTTGQKVGQVQQRKTGRFTTPAMRLANNTRSRCAGCDQLPSRALTLTRASANARKIECAEKSGQAARVNSSGQRRSSEWSRGAQRSARLGKCRLVNSAIVSKPQGDGSMPAQANGLGWHRVAPFGRILSVRQRSKPQRTLTFRLASFLRGVAIPPQSGRLHRGQRRRRTSLTLYVTGGFAA